MNVIHFTLGRVNPNSANGVNKVIEGMAKYQNKVDNVNVHVVTLKKNLKENQKNYLRDGFEVTAFNSMKGVISFFKENKNAIDLVHLHNAWSIQNIIISNYLVKESLPYIITLHGGLLLENKGRYFNHILKVVFHKLLQKNHFNKAAALHAISREEMTKVWEYTSNKKLFTIPNGIDTSLTNISKNITMRNEIYIGYLGRLSEEKNIIGLINAISMLTSETMKQVRIIIMGDYNTTYGKQCVELVNKLGLNNFFSFLGGLNQENKWKELSKLDVYIQPSFSEAGGSLSVLEAMYSKLPIIATRTCNISYLHGEEFLKMVEPIPSDLARGIEELVSARVNYIKAGDKAFNYVCKHYNWKKISKDMINQYKQIIER